MGESMLAARYYPLLLLQGVVYDRGMTHRVESREAAAPLPVTVLAISESTNYFLQADRLPRHLRLAPRRRKPVSFEDQRYQRLFHARVLDNLRLLGAKVVVFDLLFDEPRPEVDPVFARAIARHGGVILAALDDPGNYQDAQGQAQHQLQYPVPELRTAARGMGSVRILQDADETLRHFEWWSPGWDEDDLSDISIPALGVAGAAVYSGADPKTVVDKEVRATGAFLGRPVRHTPGRDPWLSCIDYFGSSGRPAGSGSVLKYEDVFRIGIGGDDPAEISRLKEHLNGRIVVVGNSSIIAQDYHRVPVISTRAGGDLDQQMAGVEVQAHITQTALYGRFIRELPTWVGLVLLFFVCMGAALLGRVVLPLTLLGSAVLLLIALNWGAMELLARAGVWQEPITASAGLLFAVMGQLGFMHFAERRDRLKLKRQLGRHVGPGIADRLDAEDWPDLTGEACELTLLFSDLQGFTSLSETMNSQEIVRVLNAYFSVLFECCFRYGGTVDKLMGDGLMVYFGRFPKDPDHAANAIRCALDMQEALRVWVALPENAGLPTLRTRIGLHTGMVTVGGIGSGEREEFTVNGDPVNVASRLEGMNKEFGSLILVSEATKEAAESTTPGIATFMSRGAATVRGRKEPMPVYSVEVE
jgi:class 3 adenylate cyclase/CHASE2 domain-containing sensor protein